MRNRAVDLPRIERAVREICSRSAKILTGMALSRRRGASHGPMQSCSVACARPGQHLGRVFEHRTENDDLVVVRDIEFSSLCQHHLPPFNGMAQVAYLPTKGRVVGLSKIARTVDVFARCPQLQERLTADIADAISEHLEARAVAVVVRAEHLCLRMRGAAKRGADMVTTAFRGEFARNQSLRAEVLGLLRPQGGL